MRVRSHSVCVTISALVAGLMLAVGASPAAAADKLTSNNDVDTKMRCRATGADRRARSTLTSPSA